MNWTRRQHEAFWNYRTRLEYVLLVKATPIANNEEARHRWDRLIWAQDQLRAAQEELDASITDAFDADRAAYECHLEATKDHAGFALIPVRLYETL